ncbi:hypothetical protein [Stenotrophomonas phage BUCTxx100]|nr:hypothetical protein [Stenotrophomonas phage BUCTxx100]
MYKLYCAFPGCGKSTIYNDAESFGFFPMITIPGFITSMSMKAFKDNLKPLFDSDSSQFDKVEFPQNYIQHIKSHIDFCSGVMPGLTMFVSSHDVVRKALKENALDYTLVYPDRSLKEEWIERYNKRGSPQSFIDLLTNKWDDFIDSCESDDGCKERFVLQSGQGLSDIIKSSL